MNVGWTQNILTPNVKHCNDSNNIKMSLDSDLKGNCVQIINNIVGQGWAKYNDLPLVSRSIIDLWDADKSQYFTITKFNNCFIICFYILITSWELREANCHFSLNSMDPTMHEQNILCSKTCLDSTVHEQTINCRQLFACHMVGSQPMERKKLKK